MLVRQKREIIPIIASLKERLETIRRSELKRIQGRLGGLSSDQEVAIESLTLGIVNSIVDTPISALKDSASDSEATTVLDIVVRLFDLDPATW